MESTEPTFVVVVLILDLFWGVANVNLELLNGSARELTSLQHVSDLCIVKQCFLRKIRSWGCSG